VKAAGFEAMRREGATLMGKVGTVFQGGSSRFFHKGMNDRWRSVFRPDDLLAYEAKVAASLSAACSDWVAKGRLATQRHAEGRLAPETISAS
jgi:hypothetical protein